MEKTVSILIASHVTFCFRGDPMRKRFDLDKFVDEFDLTGPIAVNFFYVTPMYDKVTTTEIVTEYELPPVPQFWTDPPPDHEDVE